MQPSDILATLLMLNNRKLKLHQLLFTIIFGRQRLNAIAAITQTAKAFPIDECPFIFEHK
ncbi:hypothetical protein T03_13778 [Trichinella britovi]|uniref:Uncharacterized protein n=1 Tax=Trichinella britovi TaxID=45882 RepID=A0A0V1DCD2_TRIBR|nr:hypothetical protein T03_13778 [Trichinella britovi]